LQMLTRMEAGKFRVFEELKDWFEEFRLYHHKDGRVHKEHNDLMSATRYAMMTVRFAEMPNRAKLNLGRSSRLVGSWMSA
jgi:hypothetical protein